MPQSKSLTGKARQTFMANAKISMDKLERSKESVVVKITDRGPYIRGRILDLSKAAASQIDCQLCTTTMKVLSYGDGKYRKE